MSQSMTRQKVNSLYAEFPALHKVRSPRDVWNIRVCRWNKQLFTLKRGYPGPDYWDRYGYIIWLFDSQDNLLGVSGEYPRENVWYKPWTWGKDVFNEPLTAYLEEFPTMAARTVLAIMEEFEDGNFRGLVVYKPPTGVPNMASGLALHKAGRLDPAAS